MILAILKEKLSSIFNGKTPFSLQMYILLDEDNVVQVKRAGIDDEVTDTLKTQFSKYAADKFLQNEELQLVNLSSGDGRKNVAYLYDYIQIPEGLQVLSGIKPDVDYPNYNFSEDTFSKITGFAFLVGNENENVIIYKKHYPVNLLKRDTILRIYQSKERLVKLHDTVLSLNETFEILKIKDDFIIINAKMLERYFGFEEIIRAAAEESLTLIEKSGIVEDITVLRMLTNELKYAKKIVRINKDSPVLKLPKKTILGFIANHPILQKKLKVNDKADKLTLDTKVSQELFVKLLNDDFLKSELTDLFYDSQTKDSMILEEGENVIQK